MPEIYALDDSGKSIATSVTETDLPGLNLIARGKVRDIYDLGDRLLIIATDRISAFDCILGSPIPDKGKVLTQVSLFWFEMLSKVIPNHLISTDLEELEISDVLKSHLAGRSMIVKKAEALPVECVARGYLIGSGWKEYKQSSSVCGINLPAGMRMAEKLEQPIFTPATKAESGHDENISFESAAEVVGREIAEKMRDVTLELYTRAAEYALQKGIIIADTKFEFGMVDNELILIDEVLTPDSSRFWPANSYEVGISPPSFDKQYVRDWLEQESGWDKEPPAPSLPVEVINRTRQKYLDAYKRLTGKPLIKS